MIYGKNYRKMGKFTSGAFNLNAEVVKQVDVSISVPKVPNAVIAIPRGGSPFMVSVVTTSSASSVRVACKSTKALTDRTLDVIVFIKERLIMEIKVIDVSSDQGKPDWKKSQNPA